MEKFDIEKSKARIKELEPVSMSHIEMVYLDCRRRLAEGPKFLPTSGDYGLGGVHLENARKKYVESFEARCGVMVRLCEKLMGGEIELKGK